MPLNLQHQRHTLTARIAAEWHIHFPPRILPYTNRNCRNTWTRQFDVISLWGVSSTAPRNRVWQARPSAPRSSFYLCSCNGCGDCRLTLRLMKLLDLAAGKPSYLHQYEPQQVTRQGHSCVRVRAMRIDIVEPNGTRCSSEASISTSTLLCYAISTCSM